jgi:hypothetical protein
MIYSQATRRSTTQYLTRRPLVTANYQQSEKTAKTTTLREVGCSFHAEEQRFLRNMLSRRQLQGFLGLRLERHTHRLLLISPPIVFEPTVRVTPFRVVVRPVDYTTLVVPHILTVEAHPIAVL